MRNKIRTIFILSISLLCFGLSNGLALAPTKPLPVESAFTLSINKIKPDSVTLHWDIHSGYYLYRDRIKAKLIEPKSQTLTLRKRPKAWQKSDPYFGEQSIYQNGPLEITYALPASNTQMLVEIKYQGCSIKGFCYPPVTKNLFIDRQRDNFSLSEARPQFNQVVSEQTKTLNLFKNHNIPFVLLSFLGLGILLAFTPCVLPLFPIISGLIVGNHHHVKTSKAFTLSATYVIGMASTYAIIGVIAAGLGSQLQISLQKPGVLITASAFFVLLACSVVIQK